MNLKIIVFTAFLSFFMAFGSNSVLMTETCGRRLAGRGNIVGGNYTLRGSFPWVAALMNTNGLVFCGGTLLTKNKVVTAAHCIHGKDDFYKFTATDLTVILGAHNLSIPHERGKFVVGVQDIQVHPDWNTKSKSFDADIAMLTLTDDVHFSRYIQPICLIEQNSVVARISNGYSVGYGKSDNGTKNQENVLKVVETPIQDNNEECFYTSDILLKISSKRTFCGGSRDGSGVCMGDSGNGLFVQRQNVFYLRGIVSSSLISSFSCDVNNYAVYTNVLKFTDWIDDKINSGGSKHVYDSVVGTFTSRSSKKARKTKRTTQPTTTVTTISDECGKPTLEFPKMVDGALVKHGSFPWSAVIEAGFRRITCGGTLVSNNKIVTVAHCLYDKNQSHSVEEAFISVVLGFDNYNIKTETARRQYYASEVHYHPDWNTRTSSYDADIAVIILSENVEFSDFIRPICLAAPDSNLNNINNGFIVGSLVSVPLELKVVIHADENCSKFDPKYNFMSSERTFCGGTTKGFGYSLCQESFGNGFIFTNGSTYFLRGILSVSLKNTFLGCQKDASALFTDVVKFFDWINELSLN